MGPDYPSDPVIRSSVRVNLHTACFRERVWRIVERIPRGRVSTYGDIARAAGLPRAARPVGRAMRDCPPQLELPWHRVLASGGRIALPGEQGLEQRLRLGLEGVPFRGARVLLEQCHWRIPEPWVES